MKEIPHNVPLVFVNNPSTSNPTDQASKVDSSATSDALKVEAVTPVAVVTTDEATALYLTPPQSAAIIKLTSGATKAAAASAAGVTRSTLYNWLAHDPNFQAAYNAWHKDVTTTAQSQLLAASQEAITCVLTAIRKGDSKLAWKLLEAQGLTKLDKPGSTDVGHLQRQQELDRKRTDVKELKEFNQVLESEMSTISFRTPT